MTFAEYSSKSTSSSIVLVEISLPSETKYYAKKYFTPVNSTHLYEGRLISAFDIGTKRDALTWGVLEYSGGSITLNNADGYFNQYVTDNWFVGWYGSSVTIKFGYEQLPLADYITLWTGYIESVSLTNTNFVLTVAENRKILDNVDIQASWININAMTVIKEAILLAYPDITYDSAYFDTVSWEAVAAQNILVSVDMVDMKKASEVIQDVSNSIFGIFYTNEYGKYSYKILNLDAHCTNTIQSNDIIEIPEITFDTSDIVSSVIVYCDIDEDIQTSEYAVTVEDYTRENYVYNNYGIKNNKEYLTYLPNATAACSFAIKYLDYTCDVHGTFSITVPMKYYYLTIGDTVFVNPKNVGNNEFLGMKKCEILGKTYLLDTAMIQFDLRIYYDEG